LIFTSLQFLGIFPIILFLYVVVKNKYKNVVLLLFSIYIFISFAGQYVFLILILVIFVFLYGILIETKKTSKSLYFVSGILLILIPLVYYKYSFFILHQIEYLMSIFKTDVSLVKGQPASISASIGISFYTFQMISYITEIRRGNIKAERNFINFALYILYFPKFASGPIEKPVNFLSRIKVKNDVDYQRIKQGIFIFIFGYFKKTVISDRLSLIINPYFLNSDKYYGFDVIIMIFLTSFQIYLDFSAYTDMAIGCSRIIGIQLTGNFRQPYLSNSIKDFWSRWHITLSTWLRDYIFLPLSYKFVRFMMQIKNIWINKHALNISYVTATIITMLVCGIWHGANWTFIVWGLLHGVFLCFAFLTRNHRKKFRKIFKGYTSILQYTQVLFAFTLVSVSWVFFKANDLGAAIHILSNALMFNKDVFILFNSKLVYEILLSFGFISFIIVYEIITEKKRVSYLLNYPMILLFLATIILLGRFDAIDFIYFKF